MSNSFRARKIAYKLYLKYIYILKVQNDIFGDVLWHFDTLTLWHHVVSLLMLFPKNIVFGNNLYAFWQNQHKLPYRCSGYLQLPRSFGVRKKIGMPTDNPGYEYKTFIKYYKRVWRQDAFTPFFYRSPLCYHRHLFIALLSQRRISENFREKQRISENFREF